MRRLLAPLPFAFFLVASAQAAPRSSPMSRPEPTPAARSADLGVSGVIRCTGHYRSHECTTTLYMNRCKHFVRVFWPPLRIPGTTEWEKKHRNWCTVKWESQELSEEKKFPPKRCEEIVRLMAAALNGFPELKWQDAQCTHIGSPDGFLYVSQRWERPKPLPLFSSAPKIADPDPIAVRLEDLHQCSLHVTGLRHKGVTDHEFVIERRGSGVARDGYHSIGDPGGAVRSAGAAGAIEAWDPGSGTTQGAKAPPAKTSLARTRVASHSADPWKPGGAKPVGGEVAGPPGAIALSNPVELAADLRAHSYRRFARCPVLPQQVHSWLRKFLAEVNVGLEIRNPVQ